MDSRQSNAQKEAEPGRRRAHGDEVTAFDDTTIETQGRQKCNPQTRESQNDFRVANPMDPDSFVGAPPKNRHDVPKLKFDLQSYLTRNKSDNFAMRHLNVVAQSEKGVYHSSRVEVDTRVEIKLEISASLKDDIERQITKLRATRQDAVIGCCEHALNRLMAYGGVYDSWDQLVKALLNTDQKWPEKADFTEFGSLRSNFRVAINETTNAEKKERASIRFDPGLYDQLSTVHKTLGIHLPLLCQYLVLDGIRSQPDCIYQDEMDRTINDLYFQMFRRLRRLYANVKFIWDIKPTEEVQAAMELIEGRGLAC